MIRKFFIHSTYPYIISTFMGMVGMFCYDDPIKGFVLFSYTFVIVFLVLLYLS